MSHVFLHITNDRDYSTVINTKYFTYFLHDYPNLIYTYYIDNITAANLIIQY